MPRLDRLPEANRKNLLALPVEINETTPFVRPTKPLAQCRVAIVTTAGMQSRDDKPFGPGEQSYRVIPATTPAADVVQSHTSLGFDRTATARRQHLAADRSVARAGRTRRHRDGAQPLFVHGRAARDCEDRSRDRPRGRATAGR